MWARKKVKIRRKKPQRDNAVGSRTARDESPGFRRQSVKRTSGDAKDAELASASLLVLGSGTPILKRLGIVVPPIDAGFGIVVQKNPLNPRKVIAVISGRSREEIDLAQKKIADYRKYSVLSLNGGILTDKRPDTAERGIRKTVAAPH